MRILLGALVVIWELCWLPSGVADETGESAKDVQVAVQHAAEKPQQEKGHGFSLFWIVFIVAILFVVSSATALNTLGGKPPPRSGSGDASKRKKAAEDPKDRFRL